MVRPPIQAGIEQPDECPCDRVDRLHAVRLVAVALGQASHRLRSSEVPPRTSGTM
jgi:hypothetical protein